MLRRKERRRAAKSKITMEEAVEQAWRDAGAGAGEWWSDAAHRADFARALHARLVTTSTEPALSLDLDRRARKEPKDGGGAAT